MKLFPIKNFTVELRNDRATSLNELRRNTELTDTLISEYTNKEFIGQVGDCGFKIISSEIGRGAICVFLGEFQDSIGTIEIRLHHAFKVMFSILMLLPITGLATSVATQGIGESTGGIAPMIMGVLFIRFVFIEFSFRVVSKTGLDKLTKIIGIKELN